MVDCALEVNWVIKLPYSMVSFWLIVLLIAMPLEFTTIMPYLDSWMCDVGYLDTFVGVDSVNGLFNFLGLCIERGYNMENDSGKGKSLPYWVIAI